MLQGRAKKKKKKEGEVNPFRFLLPAPCCECRCEGWSTAAILDHKVTAEDARNEVSGK